MNQNMKKSMSILLVLCLLLTLLPVSALADSAKDTDTKKVIVTFTDKVATGETVSIGNPPVHVAKDATHLSAKEAQEALKLALADEQKEYILADSAATYEITGDKTGFSAKIPVKEVKPLTVTVTFAEKDATQPIGSIQIKDAKDYQEKLTDAQIAFVEKNIPEGYLVAETPAYKIEKNETNTAGSIKITVKKQNFSLVTLVATPKNAIQGVDAYSKQMGQDLDGKITVTDTWFTPKEGYELKRILAYGFNDKTDYFEVEKGDRLTPNKDSQHTMKYEYVSSEKNADITVSAYPEKAVQKNSQQVITLPLDEQNSIKVPKATDLFTTAEGWEPAEIYAIGFDGKDSTVAVKAGDVLAVKGTAPTLRYEYNEVTKVQKINFLAGPLTAVKGTGSLDKELPLDKDGKITVPKDTDVFTPEKGYTVKEISATGFDKKNGSFTVKPGDKLTVTDKNPVIKYTYENKNETNVIMTINSKNLLVNNQKKTIDVAPIIKQERTYVPLRALVEAFGAKVDFYEANHTVIAELEGTKVIMVIGSKTYTVNGISHTMDVAPFITDSRTMVPIRFIAEAFGITVTPTYNPVDGTTATVEFRK